MTTFFLHFRSSPLRWLTILFTALALMVLFLRTDYWMGIWTETGAAAQVPAYYLSVIAAGAAAWVSGSLSRHRLEDQFAAAAISIRRIEGYRLITTIVVFVVPYAIAQGAAFIVTAKTFPPGIQLWSGYALLGAAAIALAAVWGWLVGKTMPSTYAALSALFSWLLFASVFGSGWHLTAVSGPVWKQVNSSALAARWAVILVFASLVVGFSWKNVTGNFRWIRSSATIGAALACVLVIALIPGIVTRIPPRAPICVPGKIEMCLWPESEKFAPMILDLNRRVEALPSSLRLPTRMQEYGIDRFTFRHGGATIVQLKGFDISEGNKWALAMGVSDGIISSTLEKCDRVALSRSQDIAPEAVRRWVEFFLADDNTPGYTTRGLPPTVEQAWALADEVMKWGKAQQVEWIQQQITTLRGKYCT